MSSTQGYYASYPSPSAPVGMPRKPGYQQQPAHYGPYGRMSASPPEAAYSDTTSGATSFDPSASSSSYAGSASSYDASSSGGAAGVDLLDYMNDRLYGSYNPQPLDRSLAKQTQTSGELNAKTRELMELQALAQRRLAEMQSSFADGMKTAKEVQRDLDWTQKRVNSINQRAARKYPEQYKAASGRYPAPVDY